jgi:hypothetical protein
VDVAMIEEKQALEVLKLIKLSQKPGKGKFEPGNPNDEKRQRNN